MFHVTQCRNMDHVYEYGNGNGYETRWKGEHKMGIVCRIVYICNLHTYTYTDTRVATMAATAAAAYIYSRRILPEQNTYVVRIIIIYWP